MATGRIYQSFYYFDVWARYYALTFGLKISSLKRLETPNKSRCIDYIDHNDSDYINIIDNGDAYYLKGLQTVSRHKVLALQVTTGLFSFRERGGGQNQQNENRAKTKPILAL